jgi:lysyl-tRNA synthetase class 2
MIRNFFKKNNFLEIDTNQITLLNVPEENINQINLYLKIKKKYIKCCLQTSPELALKRVVSLGFNKIYQFSHVFRNMEFDITHLPEFSSIEWYRVNQDINTLINDCEKIFFNILFLINKNFSSKEENLIIDFFKKFKVAKLRDLWIKYVGIDLDIVLEEMNNNNLLRRIIEDKNYFIQENNNFENIFYGIMGKSIELNIGLKVPYVVTNWPKKISLMAKSLNFNKLYADRFEIYFNGVELGNGCNELTDRVDQKKRFLNILKLDKFKKKRIDNFDFFLEDFDKMKKVVGIALGFDRLLMIMLKEKNIKNVSAFDGSEIFK